MPTALHTAPTFAIDEAAQDLLFREARTANAFSSEPVTDAQLAAIVDLVRLAPTGANTNPLRITFLRSEEARARLIPLLFEGNRAKAQSAPVQAILSVDLDFHEQIPRLLPFRPELKDGLEQLEAREPMGRFSATIQVGYTILAARAAGLAAGPMGGFDHEGVDREFFAGTAQRSLLVVNLGHPADEGAWFDRLPRLDPDEIATVL